MSFVIIYHRDKTIKARLYHSCTHLFYNVMESISREQLRFVHPFTMTLAGGRRTGKTHFTKTLLQRNLDLVSSPPLNMIVWFYGAQQHEVFSELDKTMQVLGQRIEFVHGLPKEKTIQELVNEWSGQRKLIVLDDLMEKASNRDDVAALFTHGRHENLSVMFLTQNFFHKSKHARDMSLNIDYAVLFKNTRDPSMVMHLGQQMGNVKFLKEAYRSATKDPFSHLFIDMRSDTPDVMRFRSNVLEEEQFLYQPID